MKNYRIATVVKIYPHPWFKRANEGVKKFSEDTGHETFLVGPPTIDGMLQAQIIKNLLEQEKVDALCVIPFFPEALERVLRKARRQGIVVITHEASNQRNTDYNIEAFDNVGYGARLLDFLAQYMGEEGEYAIFIGSLTSESHVEWAEGAIARQKERYPHMKLIGETIEDQEEQSIACAKTRKLLKTNPNLKGILGFGIVAPPGAGMAIEEAGLRGKIAIVGTSLVSVCRPYLESGAVQLISFWDSADIGYVMNKLAVMVLNGESITDGMDFGVPGYSHIKKKGEHLYGSAWIDVTKEDMNKYNF